jgi:hypothetical protein
MGCGDTCPIFPGKRYEDWELDDPAGQGVDAVRPIRDEIRDRIQTLVSEVLPPEPEDDENVKFEAMTAEHAPAVLAIYQAGIDEATPPLRRLRPPGPTSIVSACLSIALSPSTTATPPSWAGRPP